MAEFISRPPGGPLRGGKLGVPANIEEYLRDKASLEDVQMLMEQMKTKAEQADVQSLQSQVESKANITDVQKKADQTALSSLQTTVNNKADKSTVSSLQTTVNEKADKSDVSSVERRLGAFYGHKSITGNTNNNLVYSGSDIGVIRASELGDRYVLRALIHYNLTGSGTKRITLSTTDINGSDLSTITAVSETATGAMQMEVLVYPRSAGKVWVITRSNAHFQVPRVYSSERSVDLTKDRLFRLYVQNDANETVSEFTSFEAYLIR